MATVYYSCFDYIATATETAEKIVKINAVIAALEETMLKAATSDHITEYSLDNGQTKIKTVYRGIAAIQKSLDGLEIVKQRYINSLQGRVFRLVDGKNFIS